MEGSPRSSLSCAHVGLGLGSDSCTPQLGESVLHVWFLDLELDRDFLAMQEETLSAEEWRRVRRFSSHQLARRFIVRRGLMRAVLGHYLDLPSNEIMFVYNAHGKPSLAPELSSDMQFSLSHSGEKAAIAVGLGESIGIDVERLRTLQLDGERDSCESVKGRPPCARGPAAAENVFEFFQAWTRREALFKAEGVGLQMLSGLPGHKGLEDDTSSLFDGGGSLFRRGFYIHSLTLPSGFVGALASRLKEPEIVYCSSQELQPARRLSHAAAQSSFGNQSPSS